MPHLLVIYSILLLFASTLGGALPRFIDFTHRRIQMTLSLVSGVMLGVAMLHMLPQSASILGDSSRSMTICLAGLLVMFLLIRTFHFHQHDLPAGEQTACQTNHSQHAHGHTDHQACSHNHGPTPELPIIQTADTNLAHTPAASMVGPKDVTWAGLTVGLALHTLMDGLALAAAYSSEHRGSGIAALGTFLAIVLHKPLDSLTITSLMAARRASFRQQTIVNLVFSLVCPIGAILFYFFFDQWDAAGPAIIGYALAFSAGVFLCISLGDILPEVHFHSHDRIWLSLMLLLGVLVAWLIEALPGHTHLP
jgi:zinc and cadmium transporter